MVQVEWSAQNMLLAVGTRLSAGACTPAAWTHENGDSKNVPPDQQAGHESRSNGVCIMKSFHTGRELRWFGMLRFGTLGLWEVRIHVGT